MAKLRLMLFLLVFIVMTTVHTGASEEDRGNVPQEMIPSDDRGGDGFIRREDAQGTRRPKGGSGAVPGKFREDDADGNGVVSRTEFSGPPDHFDRLDTNGDGAIEESEARQGPPKREQEDR
jgi:hypothetical protein